jgi:hypothetical protein
VQVPRRAHRLATTLGDILGCAACPAETCLFGQPVPFLGKEDYLGKAGGAGEFEGGTRSG